MGDTLATGQQLTVDQQLESASGDYRVVMQGDGNLVLYEFANAPVWATNTAGIPAPHTPTHAVMQTDGNFVLYSDDGVPAWATGSNGGGNRRLVLQDDRNLVVYDDAGHPWWASNTTYVPSDQINFNKSEQVGYAKRIRTNGSLSRNGFLSADVYTENKNWSTGLRGRVLVVVFDRHNNMIWVSKEFAAATRCSVPDPSCASSGQETWTESFPDVIGKYADHVELHQADTPSFKNVRDQIIDAIKAAGDIAEAVKAVLGTLTK